MRISCPVCSTSIETSDSHIGKKGRCTNCRSKFIIPEGSDSEFEILEHGEIPADDLTENPASTLQFPAGQERTKAAAQFRLSRRNNGSRLNPLLMISGFLILASLLTLFTWEKDNSAKKPLPGTTKKTIAGQGENSQPSTITNPPEEELPLEPWTEPLPPSGNTDTAGKSNAVDIKKPFKLSEDKRSRALAYLQSPHTSKRKGAYMALRKLGEKARAIYLQLLQEAKAHHLARIGLLASKLSVDRNALTDFKKAHDNWHEVMVPARAMVHTNWKTEQPQEYKQRHEEMDDEFADVSRLYSRLKSRAERARRHNFSPLDALMGILAEINRERAWCHDKETVDRISLVEILRKAGRAEEFVSIMDCLEYTKQVTLARAAVAKHNADCNWTDSAHRRFATLLNDQRSAMDLTPLRLEEDLSRGCRDHSIDMATNDYFSHTGLTSKTRTFTNRDRRAGNTGSPRGECIFVGNPAAAAAHRAWWYSDGHRLIMYASGPGTLGLGISGNHWTLNTAR